MNTHDHPNLHPTVTQASAVPNGSAGSVHHRPAVNITPIERGGRIAIGLAAMLVGVVLLVSAGSALAVVLEVLLIAAGLDLIITGALGHCPLYKRLGYIPASLRGSP